MIQGRLGSLHESSADLIKHSVRPVLRKRAGPFFFDLFLDAFGKP